jgi:hypothetical protein
VRPAVDWVVGTSAIRIPKGLASMIISLANSMPPACKPILRKASLVKPRNPQCWSPQGLWKKSRPIWVNSGLPT